MQHRQTGQTTVSRAFLFSMFAVLAMQSPSIASAQKGGRQAAQPVAEPQAGPSAGEPSMANEKLDVSDLEKKYWAAKDSDFSVVQNRLFSKAGKYALSLSYGGYLNEPWTEGPTLGLSGSYFFSERYGVELAYSNTNSTDTQAVDRLRGQGGVPNHGKMKQFYGAAFNWVPFYAKMSVLNSSIIYFDMSISPGLGMTTYEQQVEGGNTAKSAVTATLDVTQHYFLTKWFALRFDYKNRWYYEDITQFKKPTFSDRTTTNELNHTSLFLFGGTFYY